MNGPIGEEWEKKGTLGKGAFGRVTLWEHKPTHEAIAIKECCVQLNQRNRQRWREEIEMLTKKQHQNLVGVRDIPPTLLRALNNTEPCLGMEHCEGGDLRKVLDRPANCTGLNEFSVLNILRDVSNAVQFLHSHKIIHRDLKPENILISFIGNKIIYKITDLGYAKHLDQSSVADSFVGTMKYVAPEVFSSQNGYTVTADFWSLGNVIFECITGHRPFDLEKSFVDWYSIVSKKESKDICGSEKAGEVEFQTTIPPPFKLSSPLIPMLEEWLRLVMEWNPKIRGGEKDDAGVRLCYRLTDKILSTKVVHVFCVNRCQLLSYKIKEKDTVGSLQECLEEHLTNVDRTKTSFILADGKALLSDGSLLDCYNQPGDSEWLVFAINAAELTRKSFSGNRKIYESLPDSVRNMIEKPEELKSLSELKRLWGYSLYFIGELAKTYRRLLQAQRAVMISLMSCNSELMQRKEEMSAEAYKLEANLELFLESCECDLKNFNQVGFHKNPANRQYPEELKKMMDEAKTYQQNLTEEIGNRVTCAQRELINLKNNPLVANQNTELDDISKRAKEHYEKQLKTDKSLRDSYDSIYIANLIRQVSPIWQQLESNFYTQLKKVIACKENMEQLLPEVRRIVRTMQGYRERLQQMMRQKQEMTWRSLTGGMAPSSPYSSSGFGSMTNTLTSIIEESKQEPVDPLSLIEESKDGLERLGEILQGLKEMSDTEKAEDARNGPRRQSANAILKTTRDSQFTSLAKRRTLSDPPWTNMNLPASGTIKY